MIRMREILEIHVYSSEQTNTVLFNVNKKISGIPKAVLTQHVGEARGFHFVDEKVGACSKSDNISQLRGSAGEEKRNGDNLHFNWSRCGCRWILKVNRPDI